ncbi:leader peptidase I [Prochlorococcus marinus str. MIT 9515]|uniref:Signal peptidase I n=1 Tax=Prochlorococcus marinus (strain MIT 9515) TaxID=167542 RepID=A2BVR9_PROM5|nr:signal peptidase I [Prochlorococcus marinus]ABM71880.1 leader peptidase I [Prochlorococcus marinus str. MIT 9515]
MPNLLEKKSSIKNDFKNLFIWIIISLIIRWQVIEPRWIPSGSMLPTLQIQDKILVEKITPKITSKSNLSKFKNKIIVFNVPEQLIKAGYESDIALIKRVIGTPGDKIEVKEGNLYINDIVQNNYISDSNIDYSTGPYVVPESSLWVMGDNRNNSMDSHVWGFLPYEKVIGKAIFRYWPLKDIGPIKFPSLNKIV